MTIWLSSISDELIPKIIQTHILIQITIVKSPSFLQKIVSKIEFEFTCNQSGLL